MGLQLLAAAVTAAAAEGYSYAKPKNFQTLRVQHNPLLSFLSFSIISINIIFANKHKSSIRNA